MRYPPFLPRKLFACDNGDQNSTRLLEFVLIAETRYDRQVELVRVAQEVYLMVLDTDENEISTRMSLCVMDKEAWLKSNPQMRRVYLM
jgi:hypothetical protein